MKIIISFFLLVLFLQNALAKDNIVSTGVPDLMVDIKEVSFKTYEDESLLIKVNDKNHNQLKKVCFTHKETTVFLESNMMKNICSVNLTDVEMYRITKSDKNGSTVFSNDLHIIIPFNDYYVNCEFPNDYDNLPFGEYELEIYVVDNQFKNVFIRNLDTGKKEQLKKDKEVLK